MPKNLLGGAFKDREPPTFGGWKEIRVVMMNIYVFQCLRPRLVQVAIERNDFPKKEGTLLCAPHSVRSQILLFEVPGTAIYFESSAKVD